MLKKKGKTHIDSEQLGVERRRKVGQIEVIPWRRGEVWGGGGTVGGGGWVGGGDVLLRP